MPDWYLGDTQNAVLVDEGDDPLIGGEGHDEDDEEEEDDGIDGLPVESDDRTESTVRAR